MLGYPSPRNKTSPEVQCLQGLTAAADGIAQGRLALGSTTAETVTPVLESHLNLTHAGVMIPAGVSSCAFETGGNNFPTNGSYRLGSVLPQETWAKALSVIVQLPPVWSSSGLVVRPTVAYDGMRYWQR